MYQVEYIIIQTSIISEKFRITYNLKDKVHTGYIFFRATKVMYGIPQAVTIANDLLVKPGTMWIPPHKKHSMAIDT